MPNLTAIIPIVIMLRKQSYVLICAYIVSEASTNKKYEDKMHIEARKTIFVTLLQQG